MVKTVIAQIASARQTLGLPESALRLLPPDEALSVFRTAEAHFVRSVNRRWWWEDFRLQGASVHFADGRGFETLTRIVPSATETVWWIVEDNLLPSFPVYETDTATIQQLIGECYPFEYYIIAKDLRWLVCENHSDVMIAIGTEVQTRMRCIIEQRDV